MASSAASGNPALRNTSAISCLLTSTATTQLLIPVKKRYAFTIPLPVPADGAGLPDVKDAAAVASVPRIGSAQRRARMAVRHHLATGARAATAAGAGAGVVALHATDPASVFLAIQARAQGSPAPGVIEQALYTDRTLVRMLGMRRTMFVVPAGLVPVVQAACTDEIALRLRRRYTQLLTQGGLGDDAGAWLKEVGESTALALAARGEATAAELAEDEPRLRTKIMMAEGKSYGGMQGVATWVLFLLAAEGRIVRGRPRGSWTSTQYRWVPIETWLPGGLTRPPASAARAGLLRRWLAASGPATAGDLRWWTGWTAGQVKAALAEISCTQADLGGAPGFVLAGDEDPVPEVAPWVALLPALDPTVMGWQDRGWFLGGHGQALTDRSGNIGPTVWWDGRVIGGWAQRADGRIAVRLLEDAGAAAVAAVEDEAERLRGWIGSVRVTPRFRTPLERELSG
jgi:DNA glycosylase AlkZ-like